MNEIIPYYEEKGITLYNGDCIKVMKKIPDKSVDLVVTSPPYDNLREYKGYTFNFNDIANELFRIIKDGGVVVWVVGDATIKGSETCTSFKQVLYFRKVGFNLHDTMIYRKLNRPPLNHLRYEQEFEYMFILSKGKPNIVNLITTKCLNAGKINNGTRRNGGNDMLQKIHGAGKPCKKTKPLGNIWSYAVGVEKDNKGVHPAIFPEKLAKDHIISWSNEGNTVLDPMMGSGTVGKICKLLNRNFIGIEIAQEYCDISVKRIKETNYTPPLF